MPARHISPPRLACLLCLVLALPAPAAAAAGDSAAGGAVDAQSVTGITYRTLFEDPGAVPGQDLSLENHAIAMIDATPAGERITFAFRDFNRQTIVNALVAARARGVTVDGVIDGGERSRAPVKALQAALGADHVVICGSPDFALNSCIAAGPAPSLQHNKFLTFSRLQDGRHDVVLQTSMNFLSPSQLSYYNDMVEIDGDVALHRAYVDYLFAMKAQVRSEDHSTPISGDDGRNTMFPSPRPQPDRDSADTIVDRMDEIDCSEGGSPEGHGLIRVANMAFRSERAVIMHKLVALHAAGCDIEVVLSNADGDILAGLVSAGIPVHPFFLRADGTRPQVMVHDKFWTVDARSTVTGRRTRLVYAGSSNWRADEQYSDDMLLRIADDGVYDAYERYWELIRVRAASIQPRPASDGVKPSSALTQSPPANTAGWNRDEVTLRIAASDGHNVGATGLGRLHVEMDGAQKGSWDFAAERDGYTVQELAVSAEGETEVTFFAEDASGNREAPQSTTVRIDRTPPGIAGLPAGCELWAPDHRMVHVADLAAADALSGPAGLTVAVSSGEPDDAQDVVVDGGAVDVRAEKAPRGRSRTYVIRAEATDVAGNASSATAECVVPHSQGGGGR